MRNTTHMTWAKPWCILTRYDDTMANIAMAISNGTPKPVVRCWWHPLVTVLPHDDVLVRKKMSNNGSKLNNTLNIKVAPILYSIIRTLIQLYKKFAPIKIWGTLHIIINIRYCRSKQYMQHIGSPYTNLHFKDSRLREVEYYGCQLVV